MRIKYRVFFHILKGLNKIKSGNKPLQAQLVKRQQNVNRAPLLYKRSLAPLAGNYFYYKISKPKIALTVANKS